MLVSVEHMMKEDHNKNRTLLRVQNLVVEFALGRSSKIHAVSDVSFDIDGGETLGLVGESGCGKSTIARAIVQLQKPTAGQIWFDGEDLTRCNGKRLRELRPSLQMIFQDAAASLNPGRSVGKSIGEPLRVTGGNDRKARYQMVCNVLNEVGLEPDQVYDRHPFEFSGGQCQRISIARALITKPRLLICDEPVSSLDVSIQAQILNLLENMKSRYNLTMLFISHDLAVVKNICDRVAVMYLGKLCEITDSESLYRTPRHPYTAALLASIPEPDPNATQAAVNLQSVEIPSPASPPSGCRFRTRCPNVQPRCSVEEPLLAELNPGHWAACHFPLET
jgi:peptide/nickel transport system ATP-binding protein